MVEKKNFETMKDDTWRKKGHAHPEKIPIPRVCPICNGQGVVLNYDCPLCQGEGVVY